MRRVPSIGGAKVGSAVIGLPGLGVVALGLRCSTVRDGAAPASGADAMRLAGFEPAALRSGGARSIP